MPPLQHWLVKQEPETYPWDGLWTKEALKELRRRIKAMRPGDRVLFYASGESKAVVGIAEVAKAAFPDSTADEPGWVTVGLRPVRALAKPVSLAQVKADPALAAIALVRQSRLSVMPLKREEFDRIVKLGL